MDTDRARHLKRERYATMREKTDGFLAQYGLHFPEGAGSMERRRLRDKVAHEIKDKMDPIDFEDLTMDIGTIFTQFEAPEEFGEEDEAPKGEPSIRYDSNAPTMEELPPIADVLGGRKEYVEIAGATEVRDKYTPRLTSRTRLEMHNLPQDFEGCEHELCKLMLKKYRDAPLTGTLAQMMNYSIYNWMYDQMTRVRLVEADRDPDRELTHPYKVVRNCIVLDKRLTVLQRIIYLYLNLRCMKPERAVCYVAHDTIARHVDCSIGGVKEAVARLEELGLIVVDRQPNAEHVFYLMDVRWLYYVSDALGSEPIEYEGEEAEDGDPAIDAGSHSVTE